jgi:hypothetical protein
MFCILFLSHRGTLRRRIFFGQEVALTLRHYVCTHMSRFDSRGLQLSCRLLPFSFLLVNMEGVVTPGPCESRGLLRSRRCCGRMITALAVLAVLLWLLPLPTSFLRSALNKDPTATMDNSIMMQEHRCSKGPDIMLQCSHAFKGNRMYHIIQSLHTFRRAGLQGQFRFKV